ncbi:MAG: competence/damage-inducible protein A [Rhodothermaceae bacterium]|nr:competence/damage-inducible protein A [Rhodothermaceae bacterium]
MRATILTVGDEILIGQVVDTNAAWLGEQLSLVGVTVNRMETVGDDLAVIQEALEQAFAEGDLVIVTGGLGPTHDDVTRNAVAAFFGVPLVSDPAILSALEARFAARARPMSEKNRVLAEVPVGFDVLENPKGTAPGLWGERTVGGRLQTVVMMPGVPYEMEAITTAHVLPRLQERADRVVLHKTLLTVGQGESMLADQLGALDDLFDDGLSVAFLPGRGVVRIRLTVHGSDRREAQAALDRGLARLRRDLGDLVFGEDDQTLEGVVGAMLVERGLYLSVAESCTGGAVASQLTSVPGASHYFNGGVVAYGNGVKTALLGVGVDALDEHGAVSEAVARQMAAGVREALGADLAIATTGIAGPTGGTPEKPVGTVWLGYADADETHAVRLQLTHDRAINIGLSTTAALNLVRRQLLRKDAVLEA